MKNDQLIAIEMKPLEGCAAVLVSFNRPFTHVEMNAMHRALNEHLIPHDNEPGAGGWQPIETAPIDGTPILAWVKGCNKHHDYGDTLVVRADQTMNKIYLDRGGERFWGFPGVGGLRASHWMPIPQPPAQRT